MKKKTLKILLASVAGGVLVLLLIFMLSIGFIVKSGIQMVLPKVTGTPCDIGFCMFNPFAGSVSLNNFQIGNPPGYAKKNAFVLKNLVLDVGMGSLRSDKIEIEEIVIDGMIVDFEAKLTETNLTKIKENIDKFTKKDQVAQEKGDEKETSGTSKKFQIDKFKFVNSKIILGVGGKTVEVPLADINIEKIGTSPEGATVSEVANKVFEAIYKSSSKAAINSGTDIEKLTSEQTSKIIDGVKGLFGSSKK